MTGVAQLSKPKIKPGRRSMPPALDAEITVHRDGVPVVRDAVFAVPVASALAIVGRNGAGKTSLIHGLLGLLPTTGRTTYFGRALDRQSPHGRAAAGLALVPQGRRLFPDLTVAENLRVAQLRGVGDGPEFDVHDLFPALRGLLDRRAGVLSGGEQQQVAIARALLRRPNVLVLDEPTEGLAPSLIEQVVNTLAVLRSSGLTLLMAEQHLRVVKDVCSRVLVLRAGEVAAYGSASSPEIKQQIESL